MCDRQGCGDPAEFRLGLLLRANRIDPPAKGYMKLQVCNWHRLLLTVHDVLNDAGWQKVVNSFAMAGAAQPVRSLSKLFFEPLDKPLPPSMPDEARKAIGG